MKDRVCQLLYIDDEADLLEVGRLFLERSGALLVDTAPSADEALEKIASHKYDAIISDYQMPGKDGIALLAEVRKHYGNIPFILFTGKGREEVVIQAINNGADFYLQKGGEPTAQFAELEHKVRQAIRRTRAEREVKSRERQLAVMAANIPGVVFRFLVGQEGKISFQYISERCHDILGITNDPAGFYDRFLAGLDPKYRESLLAAFGNALKTKSHLNFEGEYFKLSGETIWISMTANPLEEKEGVVFDGVLFDHTDQKRAEQALYESESTYRSLFTYTEAATIIIEKDMTISLANDAFVRLFGASREEIENKMKWTVFASPEDRDRMIGYHNLRRSTPDMPVPTAYEFQFITRQGDKRRIRLHVGMIPGTDRSVASLIDLTEIREAQEYLEESETAYRTIFEQSPSAISLTQINGKYVEVNDHFCSLFSRTREELIGRMPQETWTVNPKEIEAMHTAFEKNAGSLDKFEVYLTRPTGNPITCLISTRIIHYRSEPHVLTLIDDITEKKHAENELRAAFERVAASEDELRSSYEILKENQQKIRESERRLSDIINFLPDATFAIDRSGTVLAWNRAIEEMTGVRAEDMLGKSDKEYAIPFYGKRRPLLIDLIFEDLATIESLYRNVRREGKLLVAEADVPGTYQGKGAYLWAIAAPLYDSRGTIVGAIESVRDVSDRRRTLDALRESEERFRQLADAAQEGIIIHEGRTIRDLNRRAWELFGYPVEEMIGRDVLTLIDPPSTEIVRQRITEGSELPYEAPGLRRDGTTFWAELHSRNMIVGQHALRITTIWDITDRRKTEKALERERIFTDAVMDSVPGLLYLYDRDGHLLRWNKAHETITGYSAEELSHMHILDWYRWSEHESAIIKEGVERTLREGYGFVEARLEIKSGKKIPMYFTAVRIIIDAKPYFVGIGIDISDRKQAETAIRSANKKLNILSTITRHDILNKLTALRLFLELALEHHPSPDQDKYIREALGASDAIQRQIEFTRYYQDIGMQEPQWNGLEEVIRSALAQLDLRGIEVTTRCSGVSVFVDPLIEKVFYNLAENTVRHGGIVTHIEFSAQEKGDRLVITYTDNGIGISSEDKEHLFRKGFGENTGLGLFLSREILAITNITINECGEPGHGVKFEITVPPGGYRTGKDS